MPDTSEWVAAFAATQPFPLDKFQAEACRILAAGQSVLVAVPTGAGKTVVAEFALWLARQRGQLAVYTTPLKALSNQKFRELNARWPGEVGLLTGDVSHRPDAPVLVMTTEVLRNRLLLGDALPGVGQVILDEAHFLADPERGTVWEELVLFAPPTLQLTALSATLANADELAAWMSQVHRRTEVVAQADRPVPLIPYVALHRFERLDSLSRTDRTTRLPSGPWQDPVSLAQELNRHGFLPAIAFTFSRVRCEQQVAQLAADGIHLTTLGEQAMIREAIATALVQDPDLAESPTSRRWLEWLPLGIAPHHAGLLPNVKLLVETLFQRGLLKLVFATETLAAGINMPAKAVVLTRLLKPSKEGTRSLSVAEYRQMSGRAGRRGIDTVGQVVIVPDAGMTADDMLALVDGELEPVWSQFRLSCATVAQLFQTRKPAAIRRLLDASFAHFQSAGRRRALSDELAAIEHRLGSWSVWCPYRPTTPRAMLLDELDRINERFGRRRRGNLPEQLKQAREQVPCLGCPERTLCTAGVALLPTLVASQTTLARELANLEGSWWRRYERVVGTLREAGFADPDGLTDRGLALAGMRTEQDVAAALAWEELAGLTGDELAAVASAVVGVGGRARFWDGPSVSGQARAVLDRLGWACDNVLHVARQHDLPSVPAFLDERAAGLVQAWARGGRWADLIALSGIDEGEFVWHLRQVIDVLHQYADVPVSGAELRAALKAAAASLDRGLVQVSLGMTAGL